jgi:hypothetical protein
MRLAGDEAGIGASKHQLALLSAPLCRLRAPTNQNFAQIPDGDIDSRHEVDLDISAILYPKVAELHYFGAHALPPESNRQ